MRRKLHFESLNDTVAECERLLNSGYVKSGNWSLGQICQHIRLTMESNMNGYPKWMTILGFPLRPFMKRFGLPSLLAGKSPKGIPTAPMFTPPTNVNDVQEVDAFAQCVEQFLTWKTALHPHPGFGAMSHQEFEHFHAAHMAHHLGFLDQAKSDVDG